MPKNFQMNTDELTALLDLAWRAPKQQAEILWLRGVSDRIAALVAATSSGNAQEEQAVATPK